MPLLSNSTYSEVLQNLWAHARETGQWHYAEVFSELDDELARTEESSEQLDLLMECFEAETAVEAVKELNEIEEQRDKYKKELDDIAEQAAKILGKELVDA